MYKYQVQAIFNNRHYNPHLWHSMVQTWPFSSSSLGSETQPVEMHQCHGDNKSWARYPAPSDSPSDIQSCSTIVLPHAKSVMKHSSFVWITTSPTTLTEAHRHPLLSILLQHSEHSFIHSISSAPWLSSKCAAIIHLWYSNSTSQTYDLYREQI